MLVECLQHDADTMRKQLRPSPPGGVIDGFNLEYMRNRALRFM
jgi:hypothetical protein